MSPKSLTLVHTSDLHVGSDIYPEAALRGFNAVLDMVRSTSADALLIAGDLFDVETVQFDGLTPYEHPPGVPSIQQGPDEIAAHVTRRPGDRDLQAQLRRGRCRPARGPMPSDRPGSCARADPSSPGSPARAR